MVYYETNELYHHGILGQKWGIRRYQNPDGTYTEVGKKRRAPLRTRLDAKKDAKEYARAKMYYGEGAGTRRKLINAKVNQRSKDSAYKEEFDRYLAKQDMADHAAKARAERIARDYAGATAIAIYMGLHYTGLDKKAADYGQKVARDIMNKVGQNNFDARVMLGAFR